MKKNLQINEEKFDNHFCLSSAFNLKIEAFFSLQADFQFPFKTIFFIHDKFRINLKFLQYETLLHALKSS
jgi:hypothetical protein